MLSTLLVRFELLSFLFFFKRLQLFLLQLGVEGYSVVEAGDGEQALRLFRQFRSEIALVLTDVVMPGEIGGFDLARRVRAIRPDIPVLGLINHAMSAPKHGRAWAFSWMFQ